MTTVTTGNARLLRLAKFLRALPRKKFDYTVWVGDDWSGRPDLSCGTTACALGWATTIPSLRRAGLRLFQTRYGGLVGLRDEHAIVYDSLGAASAVFALGVDDAARLFEPDFGEVGATPKQVAKKLERFVGSRKGAAAR